VPASVPLPWVNTIVVVVATPTVVPIVAGDVMKFPDVPPPDEDPEFLKFCTPNTVKSSLKASDWDGILLATNISLKPSTRITSPLFIKNGCW
jgi:hypothetical protein